MKQLRIANDLEGFAAQARHNVVAIARRHLEGLRDDLQFFGGLASKPLAVGAIAPSGKALARAMAEQIDVSLPGPVVELGPGTGVITRALIERGVAEERLILIEASEDFAALLRKRFPRAMVIVGDAYDTPALLIGRVDEVPAAIVSGLPLFNQPLHRRLALLNPVLDILHPRGMFVQFSYHVLPPVARQHGLFTIQRSKRVWLNVPPARVWVYRKSVH